MKIKNYFAVSWKVALRFMPAALFAIFFGASFEGVSQTTFEAGTFQGILQSESNNDESFGFITIALASSGHFTMKFNLGVNGVGRHVYSKTGTFTNGVYHFEGPESADTRYAIARIIDLRLEPADAPTRIAGTVTDFTHTSVVELERVAKFDRANAAPQTGFHTFLLENPGDEGIPVGAGFGTLAVASTGRVSIKGRSADGRTFSCATAITLGNSCPVFAKIGGTTKGILSGWFDFQETGTSDFNGTCVWLGPEVPGPNHAFVNEFAGNVAVTGSRYSVPKGSPVLQTTSGNNNVTLNLHGGGLEVPISRDLTLSSANKFSFSESVRGDALSVNASTGLFTGKFLHSDGRAETFRGAILQKQNRGAGQFVDRDGEVGNAALEPK